MSIEHARQILEASKTIAVLGAHHETHRPAYYVPADLHAHGYRILPVNAVLTDRELFGEKVRATLAELAEPIDVVDIFRRSEAIPEHLDDILAMNPPPKVVWLQLGIRNDAVADKLRAHGIDVIQDRCMLADRRRLGISKAG